LNIATNNNLNTNANPNNTTNSDNYALQNSNSDKSEKSTTNFLPVWPSGFANNFNSDAVFVLKGNITQKLDFFDKVIPEFNIKSNKNDLDLTLEKCTTPKYKNNLIYLNTKTMNYNEIKPKMQGYLNKYLYFPNLFDYVNIVEVDLDLNEGEFMENIKKGKNLHCINNVSDNKKITEDLQPADFDEDMFINDFDKNSDSDQIEDIEDIIDF